MEDIPGESESCERHFRDNTVALLLEVVATYPYPIRAHRASRENKAGDPIIEICPVINHISTMEVIREHDLSRVRLLLREFPVVGLLGARQVGKTTLARQLAATYAAPLAWFDLEDPADLARLDDPGLELRPLQGLVVLDEIHRLPDIFQLLRVLADRPGPPARFLVLGSASPELLRQASESLAGRVAFHELDGFGLNEVDDLERLWLRGGFPRSYLARSEPASRRWRDGFIRTLLARDLPELGSTIPSATLRRFWAMLAHWHGQIWNGSEFGRAFGLSHATVRRYLDLLTSVFVVWQLQPWFENISKRQVRSPKVYIGDSGILHALLGLPPDGIWSHIRRSARPGRGASSQQVVHLLGGFPEQCFHWSTHTGAKLDLLVVAGARKYGFEVKRSEAPRLTRSIRSAMETLNLDRLDVVHAGTERYQLASGVRAPPCCQFDRCAATIGGVVELVKVDRDDLNRNKQLPFSQIAVSAGSGRTSCDSDDTWRVGSRAAGECSRRSEPIGQRVSLDGRR